MTDIEISRNAKLKDIYSIAKKLGLQKDQVIPFGKYKAKIEAPALSPKSKLILVTAINPTKFGEGKTTVSIGLADSMNKLGFKTALALREPSLGPVFGAKGGATGGGFSQILPMDDINLHFNGDFHAITSANNLLCSVIDNHIFQGNVLSIDRVVFNRCLDLNDRALREVEIGFDKTGNHVRKEVFNITAASEMMSILCLSENLKDLKKRLGDILVAYDKDDNPIYAKQLKCVDAMAILLKDALKPNLVQTIYGTPAIVHGGPFANIAHGCNSILATKTAMTYSDYTVTEAGFGADLGAEKFLDFKCSTFGLSPNCVVLVATVRALKLNGGQDENDITTPNLSTLEKGLSNLYRHIENIKNVYKLPLVVAVNKFTTDTKAELDLVKNNVENLGVKCCICDVWSGLAKATELAKTVAAMCDTPSKLHFAYTKKDSIQDKIKKIATKIYGADGVDYSSKALKDLLEIEKLNLSHYPVIIAKTQYSFTDNAKLLGAPTKWKLRIRELQIRNGAKFIVAIAGTMLLMPGLPKLPCAEKMTIDNDGTINGLS